MQENTTTTSKTKKYLSNLLKARFPYIYINTYEEERTISLIEDIVNDTSLIKNPRKIYIWSQTEGIRCINDPAITYGENSRNNIKALEIIQECDEAAIFILKDFHVYFGGQTRTPDFTVIRKLRDLLVELKRSIKPKSVVFLSPLLVLPLELQKDITVVDIELPTVEEIRVILDEMIEANCVDGKVDNELNEQDKEKLSRAALGLTLQEAENAFARAMVQGGNISAEDIDIILEEKRQVIRKTGILEYINSDMKAEDIGGLENLKKWLNKRNKSWLDLAKKYNLPHPKGVLITGIPGCGKSLTSKAISAMWQLPLLRLDLGKIFSGLVGSSEENMRRAIQTAEAVSPSILWVDEIEKGLGGNGGSGDSGTSSRVFGTFLTWMQEKTKPVFVIATANDISKLPAELLRKGRFDEIFFVDIPTKRERQEIFKVHLNKRLTSDFIKGEVNINDDLLNHLTEMTEGFVGSEIEQVVIAALYEAFYEERGLKISDLEKSIQNTVPLSVTQAEKIVQIREWANVRAVAATSYDDRTEYIDEEKVTKAQEKNTQPSDIRRYRGGRTIDF